MPCWLICGHGMKRLKTSAGGDGGMLGQRERREGTHRITTRKFTQRKRRYEWRLTKSDKVKDAENKVQQRMQALR